MKPLVDFLVETDRPRIKTRSLGLCSIGLAILATLLICIGYRLAHPGTPDCPVTEVWHGAMIAIVGLAAAVIGAACAIGAVGWRGANHLLGAVGLGFNAGFAALFYFLWAR